MTLKSYYVIRGDVPRFHLTVHYHPMKPVRIAAATLVMVTLGCSPADPLTRTFSARQVTGSSADSNETLRLRVTQEDNQYRMSLWDPKAKKWEALPPNFKRCTFSEILGQNTVAAQSVNGVCIEKGGLFHLSNPVDPELSKLSHTDYLLILPFPWGGLIWEAQRE